MYKEIEKVSSCTFRYSVTIGEAELKEAFQQNQKEAASSVRVDGFRRGSVPEEVVRSKYLHQMQANALEQLVRRSAADVVKDVNRELAVPAKYKITNYVPEQTFEFELTLEFQPEVEVASLKTMEIEKIESELSDKKMDDELAEFFEKFTKPVAENKVLEKKDTAVCTVTARCAGRKIKQLSQEGLRVVVGVDHDAFFLNEIGKALLGLKVGDSKVVKIDVPASQSLKGIEGRTITCTVEIFEVLTPKHAEFTDEDAKVFGTESVEKFKEGFKESLKGAYKQKLWLCNKKAVLDALAETYVFDIPPTMVEREFTGIWRMVQPDLEEARRIDDEDVRGKTDEEIQKDYRELAERRVRLGFILTQITKDLDVQLTQDQVSAAIAREVMKDPRHARQIMKLIEQHPEYVSQRILPPVLEETVIQKVLEVAAVKTKTMTDNEFEAYFETVLPDLDDEDDSSIGEDAEAYDQMGDETVDSTSDVENITEEA